MTVGLIIYLIIYMCAMTFGFGFLLGWVFCGLYVFENWDISWKIRQAKKDVEND